MSVSKKEKKTSLRPYIALRIWVCNCNRFANHLHRWTRTSESIHRRLLNVCMLLHWFPCLYMSKHLNYLLKLIFCIDFIMFLFICCFFFPCVCLLKWTLTFLLLFILCGFFFIALNRCHFVEKLTNAFDTKLGCEVQYTPDIRNAQNIFLLVML